MKPFSLPVEFFVSGDDDGCRVYDAYSFRVKSQETASDGAFESQKSWCCKGVTRQSTDELLRKLGVKIVSVVEVGEGRRRSVTFVWKDAVVLLVSSAERYGYRRSLREKSYKDEEKYIKLSYTSPMRMKEDSTYVRLCQYFKQHVASTVSRCRRKVYVLSQEKTGGFGLSSIGGLSEPLIRENYSEAVLQDYDHVKADLTEKDPCGRLIVIHGSPGTGKTFLVKGIVEAVKGVRFVLVPAKLVSCLTDPELAEVLAKQRITTCLIVEDADMLLATRGADTMSSMSALLNLADGIFGSLADVRVLCTTNAVKELHMSFDPAVIRSGRLCRKIEIPLLSSEEADRVYQRLCPGGDQVWAKSKQISLADVYRVARSKRPREDLDMSHS